MAVYLNTNSALTLYRELVNSEYFIDKSNIIEPLNKRIKTNTKYICITKPRRFGKTSILNMLGSFYCKSYDTRFIFDNLAISKSKDYAAHLNKYNVFNMCLNDLPDKGNAYDDYINLIKNSLFLSLMNGIIFSAMIYIQKINQIFWSFYEICLKIAPMLPWRT